MQQRFDEKVIKGAGCWIWTGAMNHLGYGQIWVGNRVVMAHRVSVTLSGRIIPDGYDVDHLCRVPSCVNPEHLEPVTHRENMARAPHSAVEYQRSKTHCSKGHEFSPENTVLYQRKDGGISRRCLICKRAGANTGRKSRMKASDFSPAT